jgi:RNA recognition motif-containing protein
MSEPVGEDAWLAMVDEASRSAKDLDRRVEVVELHKQAVSAEPFSLKLWSQYCEWVWSLHTDCQSGEAGWPEEEQELGRELFSLQTAMEIFEQGAQAAQYRINDSHVLWNRWISIELEELAKNPKQEAIGKLRSLFLERLQVPHAAWEETSQMFSSFLTQYDESAWESTMVSVTQLAKMAKELYSQREVQELKLKTAITSGEEAQVEAALSDYLAWEILQYSKKGGSWTLLVALYERATLLQGTNASLWEDYVTAVGTYVSEKPRRPDPLTPGQPLTPDMDTLLERATKHCPWSGALWSRYILNADLQNLDFEEVEKIKHSATSSGQLDKNGLNDVLLVYSAWCSFLRRRAFDDQADADDMDIADAGFSAALEGLKEWGQRLYGKKDYKGDPTYRLEQCYIRYLMQKGEGPEGDFTEEAREQWRNLVKNHGDSYEFWQRYYLWEMANADFYDHPDEVPRKATAVLKQAVTRRGLDWPEKIMEMYIHHCEMYESANVLAAALDLVRTNSKAVAKRREREAQEAAAAYASQQVPQPEASAEEQAVEDSPSGTKRKRDSVTAADEVAPKKVKWEEDAKLQELHQKRDRENTSVFVTNLPPTTTQTRLRQYFKEYGHINNLIHKTESDGLSSTAFVEFRTTEEAQSALLRDGKYFLDKQINVEPGTGLTLFVTNYPPTADEAYMQKLFKECGEIFSVRWPSLKYNTHRRFCYVTFRNPAAAALATQLDGKLLEGRYKLEAKYSDPSKKKAREEASSEGRELHITNVDRAASEDDLRKVFEKYGTVESVRILRNLAGKSKGGAFVVFEKPEEATAALEVDKTKLMTQILAVEMSQHKNYKPISTSNLRQASSASPGPDHDGDSQMAMSPASEHTTGENNNQHHPSKTEIAQRTITLMNIPDTVNDARVRELVMPYGTIVKLTLRPDHQGAIVEFADTASAGKAALALENHEIVPGRKLRTGGVKDLFEQKGEIRTDRVDQKPAAKKVSQAAGTTPMFVQPTAPIRRPVGPGGRGGLGTKRGLGFSASKVAKSSAGDDANGGGPDADMGGPQEVTKPKSNADFKALFLKGQEK